MTDPISAYQNMAAGKIIGEEDGADPEKAAEALRLGQATGTDPSAVYYNLDDFRKQTRLQSAAEIVRRNPALTKYVNEHPLGSTLSSDDWDNLDGATKAMDKLHEASFLGSLKQIKKNFDHLVDNPEDLPDILRAVYKGVEEGGIFGEAGSWMSPEAKAKMPERSQQAWTALGLALEIPGAAIGSTALGAAYGVEAAVEKLTGYSPQFLRTFAHAAIDPATYASMPQLFAGAEMFLGAAAKARANREAIRKEYASNILSQMDEALNVADIYHKKGEEIPVGVNQLLDRVKASKASIDAKTFDDAFRSAITGETRKRDPQTFSEILRKDPDFEIGIPVDAIRRLYGEKEPGPQDGLLGGLPDFVSQVREAASTGGDVKVKASDWFGHVEPEVHKAVLDDLRLSENGMTVNEAKVHGERVTERVKEPPQVTVPEVSAGYTRFYHGGEDPTSGGGRWVTPDREYARNFRAAGRPNSVHYVDIPEDSPLLEKSFDDTGTSQKAPYIAFEAPEEIAKQLKPLEELRAMAQEGPLPIDQVRAEAGLKPLDETLAQRGPRPVDVTAAEKGQFFGEDARRFLIDKGIDTSAMPAEAVMQHAQELGWKPAEGEFIRNKEQSVLSHIPDEILGADAAAVNKVADMVKTMTGDTVRAEPATKIHYEGREVSGIYMHLADNIPIIQWAMHELDPIGTGRHEVIHHLRRTGFFLEGEWKYLENTAIKERWIHKDWADHGSVYSRYAHLKDMTTELMLEEAVAEEFARYKRDPKEYPKELGTIFEKMSSLLRKLKTSFDAMSTKDAGVQAIFEMIESGEIAKRGPAEWAKDRIYKEAVAQLGPTDAVPPPPVGGSIDIFQRAKDLGMTVDRYRRYAKAIEKLRTEDQKAQFEASIKVQKRQQTQKWKSDEVEMRAEVQKDIGEMPGVNATLLMKMGEFNGGKVKPPKIDPKFLTPEQKAALPKEYLAPKVGFNPDDIANLFKGMFKTGSDMVDSLIQFEKDRGEASHKQYIKNMVDDETSRRMVDKYGLLEDNILDVARDHVIDTTQFDLLHEEMLGLGMRAGWGELPITVDKLRMAVRYELLDTPIRNVKLKRYLADAGRAGRATEDALLKNDVVEAFKQKQAQMIAMLKADEAKRIEKVQEKFEKIAKKFEKREVKGVAADYTNYIHGLLKRVGMEVKRTSGDLAEALDKGGYGSFKDFVQAKAGDMVHLNVDYNDLTNWLLDERVQKKYEDLTTEEFRDLHNAIVSMEKNGREEARVITQYREENLRDLIDDKMIPVIKTLGSMLFEPGKPPVGPLQAFRKVKSAHITAETTLNRWDRDDPSGIFNQMIVRPMTDAANYKFKLWKNYQRELREASKGMEERDLNKMVDNPIFRHMEDGEFMHLNMKNVLAVLQNVGNRGNLEKLAWGFSDPKGRWKVEPQQILDWLDKYTTKDDWDRAQKIGDVFGRLFDEADNMNYHLNGVGLERIELEPIKNSHGTYEGWYHPLKADPHNPGQAPKLFGPNAVADQNYHFAASTPQGYSKRRTGAIYPLELDFDVVPARMMQMIHDIAFREAIANTNKIFRDKDFVKAVTNHAGRDTMNQLHHWLFDVANIHNIQSDAAHWFERWGEYFRQNTIAMLTGLNPNTIQKHSITAAFASVREIGPVNYASQTLNLLSRDEATGKTRWRMATEKSVELERRMRIFAETVQGEPTLTLMKSGVREASMALGGAPMGFFDLLSSVPTWLETYEKAVRDGHDEGQAVALGDRAVRRSHGSSAITNRAGVMRGNALARTYTSLYNFFSDFFQRQYDIAWKGRDLYRDITGEHKLSEEQAGQFKKDIVLGVVTYMIIPAFIEQSVTPFITKDDSMLWAGTKALLHLSSPFLIGGRDLYHSLTHGGHAGAPGLIPVFMETRQKFSEDIGKVLHRGLGDSKLNARLVRDAISVLAISKGIGNKQLGQTAEFMIKFAAGREDPRDVGELLRGLKTGSSRKHK